MASHHLKFKYWPIRARNVLILLVAKKGKLNLEWDKAADWPAGKEHTPFGQLPYLEDGDVHIAQSVAIARYLGRKAHLLGDTDADFGHSEQLVHLFDELFGHIGKAQYKKPRSQAMHKALNDPIATGLKHVEKLAHGQTITGKVLLGDLAIFALLYIIVTDLKHDYLDQFPKLKAFYHHLHADPDLADFFKIEWGAYFKITDE